MTLNALWVWRYTEKVSLNNDSIHSHLHQNQSINECSRKKKLKSWSHRESWRFLWYIEELTFLIKLRWDIVLDSHFDMFYGTVREKIIGHFSVSVHWIICNYQDFLTTLELKYRINYYVIERSYMMLA